MYYAYYAGACQGVKSIFLENPRRIFCEETTKKEENQMKRVFFLMILCDFMGSGAGLSPVPAAAGE